MGSGDFRVTGKGGAGGSLTMDKGGGRAEAVLSGAKSTEHDTD